MLKENSRRYNAKTVFGNLKAYLVFKRFAVRGLKKAKSQIGIGPNGLKFRYIVHYNAFIQKFFLIFKDF